MTTTYTSTSLDPEANQAFEGAVSEVIGSRPEYGLFIAGEWTNGTGRSIVQNNPAHPSQELGAFSVASSRDVSDAVAAARRAFPEWRRTPSAQRIARLRQLSALIASNAPHLAAILSLEVGKTRVEAKGEVDECVALIEEYAVQFEQKGEEHLLVSVRPEVNASVMRPYGVFGVVVPFNFPLALLVGPSAAALIAGNVVVGKSSPTTSWGACEMASLFREAEFPEGVFNLVTGDDATGAALVAHRDLDGLVFTGSHEVGMAISRSFLADCDYARPCLTEMGGKNVAIVAQSAETESAVSGIARSAFGLSGQKCSACSRVMVHSSIHDAVFEALSHEASEWTVADPVVASARLGPVHTGEAALRFDRTSQAARADGVVATGGHRIDESWADGWFVQPTVVGELSPDHELTRTELFLPFVTLERFDSLTDAIGRCNRQVYGLTAGLFSEDELEIRQFYDEIETGTLFVNRGAGATNGGWPGTTTFVGWKGSGGTGRGALGPYYVQQFWREQNRTRVLGGESS